jgi:hypothetical protein
MHLSYIVLIPIKLHNNQMILRVVLGFDSIYLFDSCDSVYLFDSEPNNDVPIVNQTPRSGDAPHNSTKLWYARQR